MCTYQNFTQKIWKKILLLIINLSVKQINCFLFMKAYFTYNILQKFKLIREVNKQFSGFIKQVTYVLWKVWTV